MKEGTIKQIVLTPTEDGKHVHIGVHTHEVADYVDAEEVARMLLSTILTLKQQDHKIIPNQQR